MRETFDNSSEAQPTTGNLNHALRRRDPHVAELASNHHAGVSHQGYGLLSILPVLVNDYSQVDSSDVRDVGVRSNLGPRHINQSTYAFIHT